MLLFALDRARRDLRSLPRGTNLLFSMAITVFVLTVVFSLLSVSDRGSAFRALAQHLGAGRRIPIGVALALSLWFLRARHLWVYALTEIAAAAVGLAVAGDLIGPPIAVATRMLSFLAAVYVLIRGATNFDDGYQRSRDHVPRWLGKPVEAFLTFVTGRDS